MESLHWHHMGDIIFQLTDSIVCSKTFPNQHQRQHKSSAFMVLGEGNPLVTSGFPSQRARNAESISISWCSHYAILVTANAEWIPNRHSGCHCLMSNTKAKKTSDMSTLPCGLLPHILPFIHVIWWDSGRQNVKPNHNFKQMSRALIQYWDVILAV